MIKNLFKAIGITLLVAITAVGLIATLYVSFWIALASAILVLFYLVFKTLQAKATL